MDLLMKTVELLMLLLGVSAYLTTTIGLAWIAPRTVLAALACLSGSVVLVVVIPLSPFDWNHLHLGGWLLFYGISLGSLIGQQRPD